MSNEPLVGDYGEKDFIATVLAPFAATARRDMFEDCIVIEGIHGHDIAFVLNVDHPSFVRRAFKSLDDYRFYGRWVAAGVCGDVISMGVRPSGFAIDLSVPQELPVRAVEAIYDGLSVVLDKYGARLYGGNMDTADLDLVGVAWGFSRPDRLIRRSGARVGDAILVTADLGRGWAAHVMDKVGLRHAVDSNLVDEADRYSDAAVVAVEPILRCAENGFFTSGMDLSDGVLEFCHTIVCRSGLGVRLVEHVLGQHPLVREVAGLTDVRPGLFGLEPGYDFPYAHGYTVRADAVEEALAVFREHDHTALVIGEVVDSGGAVLVTVDGRVVTLPAYWADQSDIGGSRLDRWRNMVATL